MYFSILQIQLSKTSGNILLILEKLSKNFNCWKLKEFVSKIARLSNDFSNQSHAVVYVEDFRLGPVKFIDPVKVSVHSCYLCVIKDFLKINDSIFCIFTVKQKLYVLNFLLFYFVNLSQK